MLRNIQRIKQQNWLSDLFGLTILFVIFYFLWLGSYPLFTPDEGRYSEVAREMIATHDYITPRVNGVVFLDKPILYYWLQAASMHLFFVKEWALRLFPALFGILGCLVTYICGRQLFDRRTGLISSVILATSPLYFGAAHYANLDLEVAVLIACSLLFFITAAQTARYSLFIVAYFFASLAFLTKGLIGLVFPIMIVGAWMILTWRFSLLKKARIIEGLLLFAVIVTPWYAAVQMANPEFLHFFFVTQQFTRFMSAAEFNCQTPFWFYVPVVLAGFLPWTFFIFQALRQHTKNIMRAKQQHATQLFLLLWLVLIFVFFSIPRSKTIGYILPIFPALALLVGNYLSLLIERKKSYSIFLSFTACSILALLALVYNAERLNFTTAKPLVKQLQTVIKPGDEVVNYFKFYQDVPLYLGQRITLVTNWNNPSISQKDNWVRELWYGMAYQNTSDWLINEDIFWQRWNSNKRMYVFLNQNYLMQFQSHTKHYIEIGRYNDILLLSNA